MKCMKSRRYLNGLTGFLSLLGFIGLFSDERVFLVFFAFVIDFQYFFIKSDEMLDEYIDRSASRAFRCGILTTAIVALVGFFAGNQTGNKAFLTGLALGWAVSVVVYAASTAYCGFKEKWGIEDDKKQN